MQFLFGVGTFFGRFFSKGLENTTQKGTTLEILGGVWGNYKYTWVV